MGPLVKTPRTKNKRDVRANPDKFEYNLKVERLTTTSGGRRATSKQKYKHTDRRIWTGKEIKSHA